ncbi:MAG TPA: DHA2 family efflux MFS transporter permease subunit [Ilumatobacter sp.]|nr:DHA2 family efflux MFS transporter permease subunit [Ilumatobacter sp.]
MTTALTGTVPAAPAGHPRRWAILAVASLAVFITVLDGTIVNVALPSLATELGATNRQLQWIVDAYLLVFSGLLLAAGGLGDRFGRKRMLMAGLVVFGATSALAGSGDSAGALITGRALMGIGAAMIFPATLAIITNAFTDPRERAKAIGVWSAVSGTAVAFGPITGGWLLEHFWWGSVFFINVPVVAVALLAAWRLIPESREAHAPRFDGPGFVLSIASIGALVFTIIEAPEWGWTSARTFAGFVAAAVLIGLFVAVELAREHPMLPVTIFANRRFSAASVSITAAFFALFGFVFLIAQYFQLIRGYSPLEAGVRTLPVAVTIAAASIVAPRLVHQLGTTQVVRTGLGLLAAAFAWIAWRVDADTAYLEIVGQMVVMGVGLGLTTAPATESIMGSLPPDKAGVGSAVSDTTRELGGTLGVAIIGSVFSSMYVGSLDRAAENPRGVFAQLPPDAQEVTRESVGAARIVAERVAAQAGPDAAQAYLGQVSDAFLSGLRAGTLVAAAVALAGAIVASRFLPARAAAEPADEPEPALALAE